MAKNHEPKPENLVLQEKYIAYSYYKQQIQVASEELSTLSMTKHALNLAKETLESMGSMKGSADVIVPIGAQVFAKAKLADVKDVLVNIGGGVIVKKDVPAAIKSIEAEEKEVDAISEQLTAKLKEFSEKMGEAEADLEQYSAKMKEKEK
ncbi:TPA: prefoldin subunit alpha [archaeon]|nr:prefoldin subunit alpha [Candidatus Naiadarchaeales archaeon SRR2090159.bin1288]